VTYTEVKVREGLGEVEYYLYKDKPLGLLINTSTCRLTLNPLTWKIW